MASKVNKWEQKIADANPKPDYKVGEEKKTWKTNGHSGGGHTAHGTAPSSRFDLSFHFQPT
jgi:hypothetical protein